MRTASELLNRVKTFVIGGARSVDDPELFQKISLVAILAWVGLGSDGLTSPAMAPKRHFLPWEAMSRWASSSRPQRRSPYS
jgi:hypothetical protein